MEADFIKFYNDGNKAAGTRVRGAMQDLKNFAQQVRTECRRSERRQGLSLALPARCSQPVTAPRSR
ncbi:MAG: histone H1 [Myxococcales bacterium]|nr:histone H1 [Myxococcales bacterium]